MNLHSIYQRLFVTTIKDIEVLMADPDPLKRAPKLIWSYCELAKSCQDQLKLEELNTVENESQIEWDLLSVATRQKILELIELDQATIKGPAHVQIEDKPG